jgi:anti-sigma B factor antagonist
MNSIQTSNLLSREDFGDVTVLRVKATTLAHDNVTDAVFEQAYAVVEAEGRSRIVLNLDPVLFLASAALGKLVNLLRKVRAAGGRLILCKVKRPLEELFRITRMADILIAYEDEQEAVQSFR